MAVTTAPPRRASSGSAPPPRLAPLKPRRNGALIAVGVLLIVGFGLIGAVLQLKAANRTAVLVVARPVPAGQVIQDADLQAVKISTGSSVRAIAASDRSTVVGRAAALPLVPGSLVNRGELADSTTVGKGKVVVGLSLKAGQIPTSAVRAGDRVLVVVTGAAADALTSNGSSSGAGAQDPRGAVLVQDATVFGVDGPTRNADDTTVSLMVDERDAPALAGAANVGQVTLVLRSAS